jgi:outer membrane protein OmpA-like peptidoglycan-associated protein
MIPKYHRCGDPSQKCPLSVTKELLKNDPKWTCPCANPNCVNFQEPVSFFVVHRLWFIGAATLVLLFLLLTLLGSKDPCVPKLNDFQARFTKLEKDVASLQGRPKTDGAFATKLVRDVTDLGSDTKKLLQAADQAIEREDLGAVERLKSEVKKRLESAKILSQSLDKPESGSGVVAAEAKALVGKLITLQQEVEEQQEIAEGQCPKHLGDFETMAAAVAASISKTRRLTTGDALTATVDANLISAIKKSIAELQASHDQLVSLPPPQLITKPPFTDADLIIGAAPGIAERLVGPLAAAWTSSTIIPGPDDVLLFIDGGAGKKLVVKPMSSENGFESLAAGNVALFFADRSPTDAELARFGTGFKESRSVAEVVALDALTLLVHPDNPIDTYEIGQSLSLKAAAGTEGSAVRSKAEQFGLRSSAISEAIGEEAAMQDRNVLACGLYHLEGKNLRAKRLAVRASKDSSALKPSPFTIATEEYLYSYRIVAWTHSKPKQLALDLVAFITSDTGQAAVKESGFVDLRLVGDGGKAEPAKLAALGEAIGSKTISDARRLSTNIRFEVNDAQLDLKAQADLERITRTAASDYPKHTVVILGFTDSSGGTTINQPLSVKRADAVAAELRRSKVDTKSNGLGDLFPIDTNETEAGKARNRRAEVWVVKP